MEMMAEDLLSPGGASGAGDAVQGELWTGNMTNLGCKDLSQYFHQQLTKVQQVMAFGTLAKDPERLPALGRLERNVQEVQDLSKLLEQRLDQQEELLTHLQEFESVLEENIQDCKHLKDILVVPVLCVQDALGGHQTHKDPIKKMEINGKPIKEMARITPAEFLSIPQYMKGRFTHEQLNATVECFNAAIREKYKVLFQPPRSLTNVGRKLLQRFKEQESRDTKGKFFVVEEDIREFSQCKTDKRFQLCVTMLRHCQRLREARGGGLTRYILL